MAVIIRSFRFKLNPTKSQHGRLREALERSRQLYNAALEERIDCYRKTGKGRSYADQCRALSELRREGTPFSSSMERGALKAIDRSYAAFFRRGGFPRFKGRDWFKAIVWTDGDGWKFTDGVLYAKGLGRIRVQQHRPLPSVPVSCRIKRQGRHWFVSLACKISPAENDNEASVGVDFGLLSFAALSDGTLVPAPRCGRKGRAELRRRQRALARCKKGSRRRRRAKERVAVAHLRTSQARRTHHFQTASDLCRRFGLIAIENLNVKGLARGILARDVNDAAWGQFIEILQAKAESAGVQVVKVDPRHTSQTCPECSATEPKKLSERVHRCPCGYEADRDVAAARVILMRAVHGPPGANVGGYVERSPRKAAA